MYKPSRRSIDEADQPFNLLVKYLLIGFRDTARALKSRGIDIARIFTDRNYEKKLKAEGVNLEAIFNDIESEFSRK